MYGMGGGEAEDRTGQSNDQRKVYWAPVITLGNILTAVAMLLGGLVPFFNLKSDVQLVQLQVQEQGLSLKAVQELITSRGPLRYDRPDAQRDFDLRDRRLDDHEHRIQVIERDMVKFDKGEQK